MTPATDTPDGTMEAECQQVHAALREGGSTDDPAVARHVATCEACAAALAGGPALARALDEVAPSLDFEALRTRIDATLERERGPVAWLRSRPTPWRTMMAIALAGLIPLAVALAWGRPDAGVYPSTRLLLDLLVVLVPATLVLLIAMRPLFRPAVPRALELGAVGLAVLGVLVGPMLAPAHADHPASLLGTGPELGRYAVGCLVTGIVLALPMLGWMTMLLRRRGRFGLPLGAALVLCGLVGSVAVFLHCPIVAPEHLLLGHSTVLLAFLVLGVVSGVARPRE